MTPVSLLAFDRNEYHSVQLKTVDSELQVVSGEKTDGESFMPFENKYDSYFIPKQSLS